MTSNSTVDFEIIKNILAKRLDIEENMITKDASIIDDLGADSIDTIEIIMEFEKAFKIDIPENEVYKLLSVNDIIKYIENKLQNG